MAQYESLPEWRKKLKIKSSTSLGLPLFIDPALCSGKIELSDSEGRAWRMLQSKKMQQAYHQDPQKFNEWQSRVQRFYKRAMWGPVPKDADIDEAKKLNSRNEPVLPSATLWHYYYHGGKSRMERRKENLQRIESMKVEHQRILESRKFVHKQRISNFAQKGVARRDKKLHKKVPQVDLQEKILLKHACEEAAIQIQTIGRGFIARGKFTFMKSTGTYQIKASTGNSNLDFSISATASIKVNLCESTEHKHMNTEDYSDVIGESIKLEAELTNDNLESIERETKFKSESNIKHADADDDQKSQEEISKSLDEEFQNIESVNDELELIEKEIETKAEKKSDLNHEQASQQHVSKSLDEEFRNVESVNDTLELIEIETKTEANVKNIDLRDEQANPHDASKSSDENSLFKTAESATSDVETVERQAEFETKSQVEIVESSEEHVNQQDASNSPDANVESKNSQLETKSNIEAGEISKVEEKQYTVSNSAKEDLELPKDGGSVSMTAKRPINSAEESLSIPINSNTIVQVPRPPCGPRPPPNPNPRAETKLNEIAGHSQLNSLGSIPEAMNKIGTVKQPPTTYTGSEMNSEGKEPLQKSPKSEQAPPTQN